jgi:nitrite reductase (NADH) small subunit
MIRVCSTDDVPLGEGRAVVLGGRRIAIFHTPSGWYALDAVCPHRGGPLEDGIVSDRSVICPLHERSFDLETGAAATPDCPSVRAYPVDVTLDDVFVKLRPFVRQSAGRHRPARAAAPGGTA